MKNSQFADSENSYDGDILRAYFETKPSHLKPANAAAQRSAKIARTESDSSFPISEDCIVVSSLSAGVFARDVHFVHSERLAQKKRFQPTQTAREASKALRG